MPFWEQSLSPCAKCTEQSSLCSEEINTKDFKEEVQVLFSSVQAVAAVPKIPTKALCS